MPLDRPNTYFEGPLYKLKFWTSVAIGSAPASGIARAAIDDFVDLARHKTPAYTATALRERATVQSHVAGAEAELGAGRAYVYEALEEAWETAL